MQYVDVQGARLAALGFGTWQITGRDCQAVVEAALAIGYRHIDTAQAYGNEYEVGRALSTSGLDPEEVWVTTKVSTSNMRRDDVLRSGRNSQQRLGIGRIDLLLIHWPSRDVPLAETLEAMQQLQDEGVTRYIGVSNFSESQLVEAAQMAPILCNQVEYHPFTEQRRLRSAIARMDLALVAYSPLARGRVVGERTLKRIGGEYGKSAAQVALRWLLQQKNVAAIPKAQSREHAASNFAVFDFDLSEEHMAEIDALSQQRDNDARGAMA